MEEEGDDATRLALARWLFSPLAGIRAGDWLTLLGRHGAGIPPRYWPRSLFTTAMAALNSPLARLEERRHGDEIERQQVRAPVFVLGHHRSGTTHLWNLLALDPQFIYPNVLQAVFPHTFLTAEAALQKWARRLSPRRRPQDRVRFSPDSPIEEERAICTATFLSMQMARHFPRRRDDFRRFLTLREASPAERERWQSALDRFARKLLVRHAGSGRPLFKAPDHTGKLRYLLELYPDARFVHIHRDPYVVYRSTYSMERTTIPLYAYQRWDPEALAPFILWRYRTMYRAFFEDLDEVVPSGQITEVSFAELEADPLATLARVYDDLGLGDFASARPSVEAYLRGLGGYRRNTYAELPEEDRREIREHWHEAFARWGYEQ